MKPKPSSWTFKPAFGALALLMIWAEVASWLFHGLRDTPGGGRWGFAVGFFFALLPLLSLFVYRGHLVFGFFRSVQVGVSNLILIGLGSIAGVLFHQEDADFRIPVDGVESLVIRQEEDQSTPWTRSERQTYQHYEKFVDAHAYFTYHLLHGVGFHSLPGVEGHCIVDPGEVEAKIEVLDGNLVSIRQRLGEEYAVGLRAQSETGLRVRQENDEIAAFASAWSDTWWTLFVWADRLDFIRVYRSDWFGILFFVLFGGVLSNTFRGGWRRLLRPRKWGFVVTHAGVMILLVSAFWGRLTEQRGIVQLHLGEASSSFQGYDGIGRPFKAPTLSGDEPLFGVRLEGFRADYHDVLDVIYATEDGERLAEEFTGLEPPKFRVYQDQVLHFDWGQDAGLPTTLAEAGSASLAPWLRLEVTEYIPQSVNKPILRGSKDGEEGVPMARIASVHPQAGIEEEGILFHHFPMPFSDAQSGARVLFRKVNEVDEAVALATEPVVEHFGWIRQKMPVGMEARDPIEVRPGAEFAVRSGGQELKVEIVKAVPVLRLRRGLDGRVEHDPQETGPSWMKATNPGVLVKIYGNDGILEERWVAEQAAHGAEATLFPGVEFEFAWDPWSAPALSRWWIFQNTAGQCWLAEAGKPDTMKEIKPGERWPVSADRSLELLQAFPSALSEQTMDSLVGADFFHPAPGSIRLKITTPKGVEEQVLSAEGQGDWHRVRYLGPDGQARLVLLHFRRDTEDLPLEWRSKLVFHKVDPHGEWLEESAGEIRVNDYYFHRGYRFFQTDARPDDPTYSGVGVVYDPGIEGVLIGLYMVMFGTLVVFLVNPLVTRKHRGA